MGQYWPSEKNNTSSRFLDSKTMSTKFAWNWKSHQTISVNVNQTLETEEVLGSREFPFVDLHP